MVVLKTRGYISSSRDIKRHNIQVQTKQEWHDQVDSSVVKDKNIWPPKPDDLLWPSLHQVTEEVGHLQANHQPTPLRSWQSSSSQFLRITALGAFLGGGSPNADDSKDYGTNKVPGIWPYSWPKSVEDIWHFRWVIHQYMIIYDYIQQWTQAVSVERGQPWFKFEVQKWWEPRRTQNLLHSLRFTSNQLCNEVLELWPTSFRENCAFTFEINEPKMVRNI